MPLPEDIRVGPQNQLLRILSTTRAQHPNFVVFLGAGASVKSGIRPASDMIADWKLALYEMAKESCGDILPFEDWLQQQTWKDDPNQYAHLFETCYQEPSQRRDFIETCIAGAKPSWGYIYLVNLLRNNVFNAIFTTNFDDLLTEACYKFSRDVRPVVCAHESALRSIRVTSKRPKIIKLHGDFLFDNIKNTARETEKLEENMKEKFKQYAREYGFIFVGYGGRDRTVMDTLEELMSDGANFPHGIYWCVRKGDLLTERVIRLSRFPKVHLISIEGFDDFFAGLHNALGFALQEEMADPYEALTRTLNDLVSSVGITELSSTNSIIARDIEAIGAKIAASRAEINPDFQHEVRVKMPSGGSLRLEVPYRLLADIQHSRGDTRRALLFLHREFQLRRSGKTISRALEVASEAGLTEEAHVFVGLLQASPEILSAEPSESLDMTVALIDLKLYDEATQVADLGYRAAQESMTDGFEPSYYFLNRYQIKVWQGIELEAEEVERLNEYLETGSTASKMGAAILLKNFPLAESLLFTLLEREDFTPESVMRWPIVRLLADSEPSEKFKKLYQRHRARRKARLRSKESAQGELSITATEITRPPEEEEVKE